MRFRELYQTKRPAITFEIFPPKNVQAREKLNEALPRLIALRPDMMTVTYGALGSSRDRTLETASRIKQKYGMETACHLTCVGASRADLDDILERLHESHLHNIVALRGDPPRGEAAEGFVQPEDSPRYANELIEHIHDWERRRGVEPFGIAVAGYPEKHIQAPDMTTDLANLKRKVDAGVDSVVTQLFFDNADYYKFVEDARALGVTVPIVPGLMPISSAKQIKTMTEMCGAKIHPELHAELDAAGEDAEAAMEVGVAHCLEQAKDLLEQGVPGIHFYVLNRADHMERIMQGLNPA